RNIWQPRRERRYATIHGHVRSPNPARYHLDLPRHVELAVEDETVPLVGGSVAFLQAQIVDVEESIDRILRAVKRYLIVVGEVKSFGKRVVDVEAPLPVLAAGRTLGDAHQQRVVPGLGRGLDVGDLIARRIWTTRARAHTARLHGLSARGIDDGAGIDAVRAAQEIRVRPFGQLPEEAADEETRTKVVDSVSRNSKVLRHL